MLSVGVGARPGAELAALVAEVLDGIAARPDVIATIDRRAGEAAAVAAAYGCSVVTFTAEELAEAGTLSGSGSTGLVEAAVGAPSVAEAAALLAAGPGARLLVGKRRTADATAAVATSRGEDVR